MMTHWDAPSLQVIQWNTIQGKLADVTNPHSGSISLSKIITPQGVKILTWF